MLVKKNRLLVLSLVILMSGCYTTLDRLDNYGYSGTVDDVLRTNFTKEAYDLIKDIPMVVSPTASTAYAAGTSFGSKTMSLLLGHGIGRKVVVSESFIKKDIIPTIIHEYVHHIDDIGRDSGDSLINIDEFLLAYKMCYKHQYYHGITLFVESAANRFVTDVFGIGDYSEHIAYTSQVVLFHDRVLPEMQWAFRKVFGRFSNASIPN